MQNSNAKLTETEKAFVSLKAFLPQDPQVCKIIQLCNLHPVNSWRHWTDFLGHSLIVSENKKVSIFKVAIKFPFEFIRVYLFQRNFLNGYEGFIWSMLASYSSFIKYAKLFDLNYNKPL